jgi:hypothetical protein
MNLRFAALALPLFLGLACAEQSAAPDAALTTPGSIMAANTKGTGLILHSVTGIPILGDITIDQAEITNFALIENTVGQIVGLQADGVLQLTGGALGTDVVSQDFSSTVSVTSSGPGQCDIVTLDIAPFDVDPLGLGLVQVDIPAASVTGKGSGAVGSLLCNLGQLLNPVTQGVRGVVQALNRLI